ncbi:GNAT family N-acetyltransferase [Brevibacillus dissolubilis]|uniref:GNAT family N-acetyltransferase n=1 Tax=Brevibacillus dissolubilis TaxID=1844116 RepID=UPI00159BCD40|nr:GNAT family N-acetyltransferase [Brevibacillus dissolubilis]
MIETRVALTEDDPFLFEVYASTRREEMEQWGWDEAQQVPFLRMQFDLQTRSYQMHYPGLDRRIILYENTPVGRILVARLNNEWVLVDISLLPAYRGRGIGTRLIAELQQEAAGSDMPVRLSVSHTNPRAQQLYTKLGFIAVASNEMQTSMVYGGSSLPPQSG